MLRMDVQSSPQSSGLEFDVQSCLSNFDRTTSTVKDNSKHQKHQAALDITNHTESTPLFTSRAPRGFSHDGVDPLLVRIDFNDHQPRHPIFRRDSLKETHDSESTCFKQNMWRCDPRVVGEVVCLLCHFSMLCLTSGF